MSFTPLEQMLDYWTDADIETVEESSDDLILTRDKERDIARVAVPEVAAVLDALTETFPPEGTMWTTRHKGTFTPLPSVYRSQGPDKPILMCIPGGGVFEMRAPRWWYAGVDATQDDLIAVDAPIEWKVM